MNRIESFSAEVQLNCRVIIIPEQQCLPEIRCCGGTGEAAEEGAKSNTIGARILQSQHCTAAAEAEAGAVPRTGVVGWGQMCSPEHSEL